jgi:ribosomal protein S27AE
MRAGFVNKKCPKCGGNVFIDRDVYGWYEKCLQCGYTQDLKALIETWQNRREGQRLTVGRR